MKVKILPAMLLGAIVALSMGCENESNNSLLPRVEKPVINPNGGEFTTSQQVDLASASINAKIYYTLDGSEPTASSNLYSKPFTLKKTTTVNAIGIKDEYNPSDIVVATFRKENDPTPVPETVATPSINPNGGEFSTSQRVTLASASINASIYYTLDGSKPTTKSTLYKKPFTLKKTTTVKAIGMEKDYNPSSIATATFQKKEDILPTDKEYPYLPIKLKEFVVTDKNSPLNGATEEDHKRARVITIEEKAHILETIDLMRFVINTPEFKTEFFLDVYRYKAAEDGNGIRTIKKGEYFDKNIIFNIIKNAAITTYFLKDDLSSGSNAAATAGPYFYVTVDAENPIVEGDNNKPVWEDQRLDLLIILPNSHTWTSSIYEDKYYLAGLLFHELIHNLGFKHADFSYQDDLAVGVQDIFREVVNSGWKKKYKTELAEYNYYQTTYASFLTSDTVPK